MESENKKRPLPKLERAQEQARASSGLEECSSTESTGYSQSTHITNECDEKISKLGAGGCAWRHGCACFRGLFGNVSHSPSTQRNAWMGRSNRGDALNHPSTPKDG
jgi:hypothetical protein